MPTLTLTNLTSSRLPIGQSIGVLEPNETRQLVLTANELELSSASLVRLDEAGVIVWTSAPTSQDSDNEAEVVMGGARVLAGTGTPVSIVVGDIGDLYCRKDGGANTTLYVKESGSGTSTGWVAK